MSKSPFLFSCHDLPRRAGELREVELDLDSHEPLGIPLMAIPSHEVIEIDLRIEAVTEGVLATGIVRGLAVGECTRCLDPVEMELEEQFQELFYYEVDSRQSRKGGARHQKDKKHKKHKKEEEIEVEGAEELLTMQGDEIDLEGPIRDALILNLPVNPLCSERCLGLCSGCGVKWESLPDDHIHELVDPRWAALSGLDGPGFGQDGVGKA